MKKLILIIFIFIFSHCSFDNKTGIWKNSNTVDFKKKDRFKDFETFYTKEKSFNDSEDSFAYRRALSSLKSDKIIINLGSPLFT